MDFGFFAAVPRIVRTQYKHLNPTQKWLYVCLKDLCGDHGTCYRTLRTLSDETDISIAMLSKSIPELHEAGLIHAEKKRRENNPTGKEVWHITIVDVWTANGQLYPTKRSQDEQQCSPQEQSTSEADRDVHEVNNNVHDMNKKGPHCSCGEQQCSRGERGQSRESASEEGRGAQNRGGRNNRKGIPTGRIPEKEEESAAPPPQHHEKKDAVSGNKSQVAENTSVDYEQSDLFQQASPGVQAIITEWRAYQGPMPVTAELLAQAEELAAYQPEPGEIQACADWKYANDKKGWHAQHGMTLGHVAKDMPRFRSIKKRAQAASSPRAQQGNEASELAAAKERAKANNQQTLDRVRKMLAAKQQVAQGGNQQHAEAQYH
jgi:hypothetical protein